MRRTNVGGLPIGFGCRCSLWPSLENEVCHAYCCPWSCKYLAVVCVVGLCRAGYRLF
jgi:hypothetical protein